MRHVGRIHWERVLTVHVLVAVITTVLPRRRHGDAVKSGGMGPHLPERILHIVDARVVTKCPLAAKQHKTVGFLTVLHRVSETRRSRYIVRTDGHRALMQYGDVLIVFRYQHNIVPPLQCLDMHYILQKRRQPYL